MPETLMSPSKILMYGRVLKDIKLQPEVLKKENGPGGSGGGGDKLLFNQLTYEGANLARIYAMSFEGTFYNLPKPAIFLVHGKGTDPRTLGFAPSELDRPDMDASGMAARDFEWEGDVKYWEYDKKDFSLRLDVVTGWLDEILVDATLSATSRYALTSRADLTARADLAARADVASRADLTSRADLSARHRLRE